MPNTSTTKRLLIILVLTCFGLAALSADGATDRKKDTHYNAAGFFDVHVCNWPDRKLFFLALFSTFEFDRVKSVTVYRPDGTALGNLDLSRYRVIRKKGKPEKRAFISEFDTSDKDHDGWYSALVQFRDGKQFHARDFVMLKRLGQPVIAFPGNGEHLVQPPGYLEWQAVPGAKYYKVFIRDMWDENRLIHESKLINTNHYQLPKDLVKPGGWYSWKVHARDINEDPKLGDFNHGSLSIEAQFDVKE